MKKILHTVNKSPFSSTVLKQCLDRTSNNDTIVLLEDGVYGALSTHAYSTVLGTQHCYAIEHDIIARGIHSQILLPHIQLINYDAFVALTIEHELTQSWY